MKEKAIKSMVGGKSPSLDSLIRHGNRCTHGTVFEAKKQGQDRTDRSHWLSLTRIIGLGRFISNV